METPQTIYGSSEPKNKRRDINIKENNNKKRRARLVIKNKNTTIKVESEHIEIKDDSNHYIIGIINICAIYLHKDLAIKLSDFYALSKYLGVYIIDAKGTVLGKFKRFQYE